MKSTIALLIVSLALVSCLDEIKLPRIDNQTRLVVEGTLTDQSFFLRILSTDGVGSPKRILASAGLYVEIQADNGQKFRLRVDPSGTGLFTAEQNNLKAIVGVGYRLYIKTSDGTEYSSEYQKMPSSIPIASLSFTPTETPKVGFLINAAFQDPKAEENYYRWKAEGFHLRRSVGVPVNFNSFCCNICWVKESTEGVNVLSDQNINGGFVKDQQVYFSPYFGEGLQFVKVTQFVSSKPAYQYYKKLNTQLNRSGSIFDPLPATIVGNVNNIANPKDNALGFFEVSSVSTKVLRIQSTSLLKYDAFYKSPSFVPDGDCMLRFPFSSYFGSEDPKF